MLATATTTHAQDSADSFTQRELYLQAMDALQQGKTRRFEKLKVQLKDYVLFPYLRYHQLRKRVSSAKVEQITQFRADHPELPAADILHRRWLRSLGKRRQWTTFRKHYEPSTDARLRCYHLRALFAGGDKVEALRGATELWLAPKSQPDACDPLFDEWLVSDEFSEEVAWQRLQATIDANQRSLARYLTRFFNGDNKTAAEAFYRLHVAPDSITSSRGHPTKSAKMRVAVEHGLHRLSSRDAHRAAKAWADYRKRGDFSEQTSQRIDEFIAAGLAGEGQFPDNAQRPTIAAPDSIEKIATAALHEANWPETSYWVQRLPSDIQSKSQWQYWLARALLEQDPASTQIEPLLTELAKQRHYYGFLAARMLGVPGQMNEERTPVNALTLTQLQTNPNIQRATELFAVNDGINGRREWYRALEGLDQLEQLTAAELASQLGHTSLAIRTANIAEARNHLHLRFPMVHESQFRRASLRTALPVSQLIAIARQESALQDDARSSANARGLMQLLPSTAKLVAKRARLASPSAKDLNDPSTNIALGSYHLAWLIKRFNGLTPLAMAGYNAGEHRVDRWIKDVDRMPMDLWIERIPFRETRNYVKNVLAFRHVYAHQLGQQTPILGTHEQFVSAP